MKKIISAVCGLLLGSLVFAYSDFSFKLAPVMSQEVYVFSGDTQAKGNAACNWEIGIVNYNYFDENAHIGCFEMINYSFGNFVAANVALGIAGGVDAGSSIRFQGGLGLRLSYGIKTSNTYVSGTGYITNTESNLKVGFLTDFGLKLTPYKLFSPIIGFTLIYDPICNNIINTDGVSSVRAYSSYSNFGISPYINFCINLK